MDTHDTNILRLGQNTENGKVVKAVNMVYTALVRRINPRNKQRPIYAVIVLIGLALGMCFKRFCLSQDTELHANGNHAYSRIEEGTDTPAAVPGHDTTSDTTTTEQSQQGGTAAGTSTTQATTAGVEQSVGPHTQSAPQL